MKKFYKIFYISLIIIFAFSIAMPVFTQGKPKTKKENKKGRRKKKPKTFYVDFRDKDIQDFLKSMSKILKRNIITDDKVKGKITVISPRGLPVSEAFRYIKSVLAVKGFGVVKEGKLIKVFPMKEAVAKGQDIYYNNNDIDESKLEDERIVTHIRTVYNQTPSRMAAILKRITNSTTEVVVYDEIGTVVITGGAYEVNRLVKILKHLDKEETEVDDPTCSENPKAEGCGKKTNIHIYYLENLEAEKIEAMLRRLPVPESNTSATGNSFGKKGKKKKSPTPRRPVNNANTKKIDVFAHKESNSIIYIGEKKEFQKIVNLIKQIDVARDQVLLEVLIVEIIANDTNAFGIDWRVTGGKTTSGVQGQFNNGLAAQGNLVKSDGTLSGVNTLLGFSLGFLESASGALGILNANLSNQNFNVLSSPQVLALDNEEAEINVGEDIPVQTAARTSGGGDNTVNIQNFEYRPTGVKLKFTPKINKNEMITLKIFQEVKDVASTQTVTSNPTFTKRDIKTTVRVKDKQTIVIGGLISKNKTRELRKIPILGDIPLIKYLFRRSSTSIRKTNLLVFITPHILSNRNRADKVTTEMIESQSKEAKEREKDYN